MLAIELHPEDQKRGACQRIKLSALSKKNGCILTLVEFRMEFAANYVPSRRILGDRTAALAKE